MCGKKIQVYVPTKYDYKEITVSCGSTSPHGTPWLCDDCAKLHAGRDWRREAEMNGETWGPEDY